FDRGPWLAIAFAGGIAAWFVLDGPLEWVLMASGCMLAVLGAVTMWRGLEARAHVLAAVVSVGLLMAAGLGIVWTRSALTGAEPIDRALSTPLAGRVLERIVQPAEGRVRIVLATRLPGEERAIKVRVNVPLAKDLPELTQ